MGKSSEVLSSLFIIQPDKSQEGRIKSSYLNASPDIAMYLQNIDNLTVSPGTSGILQKTLKHLAAKISATMSELNSHGAEYFFAGPQWCRQNIDQAAIAHAKVIIDTYGATYALPNKNPEANKQALRDGTDMYLTFKDGQPVGTACLVPVGNGMAELGRAASQGKVGNRVIQDLRIIDWLVNTVTASKYHTIFATCRTAPNRDIGAPELMRGGQAVSHMWGEMPGLIVGGFGPLYKKHGALETFAYSVLTREEINIPQKLWIADRVDAAFVRDWCENYHLNIPFIVNADRTNPASYIFHPEYPPKESGVTDLVHGEIKMHQSNHKGELNYAIDELFHAGVPFIQVPVPLDQNTIEIQRYLKDQGFQAFIFTPGYGDRQGPQLWFGKPVNVPVVPRYWDVESGKDNPFWGEKLEQHGRRIAKSW